ncbi:hypothetical protein PVL29_012012 [Vitis rotundifolia]|uniref:Uncharacterized protein n=1 Tax=Vitis rotundifolia TaxID=103349 RepID=A0AA39DRK0_VITRO|nr:hypothetical protein PVL29_012012 [Vitis rotundifolia]
MSPILQYSPEYDLLSGTRPDNILSVVDSAVLGRIDFPSVCYSSVLTRIRSLLRYSPEYDLFSGTRPDNSISVLDSPRLARIRFPVCLIRTDSSPCLSGILRYSPGYHHFYLGFFGTRTNSIPCPYVILRYSPEYDLFCSTRPDSIISILDSPVLAWIRFLVCLVFSDTCPDSISSSDSILRLSPILQYSPEYDLLSGTHPNTILSVSSTHPNTISSLILTQIPSFLSRILRYSRRLIPRMFVILRYSLEYDLLSGTRLDTILSVLDSALLARIDSPSVCYSPVLTRIPSFLSWILWYSHEFDSPSVCYSPILRLSPILRYSPEYDLLSGAHPDTILSVLDSSVLERIDSLSVYYSSVLARIRSLLRYSPGYHHFCLGFSGTRTDSIPCLFGILRYSPGEDAFFLLFSSTRRDSILRLSPILRYSPEYDLLSGTRSDTILFVLDSAVLERIDSPSVCYSLVLARIRSLLWYLLGYHYFCLRFSGTRMDSIPCLSGILRYSLG